MEYVCFFFQIILLIKGLFNEVIIFNGVNIGSVIGKIKLFNYYLYFIEK